MVKYCTVTFENDYYTIPEIVDKISETLDVTVRDTHNKRNSAYFRLEKQIRRSLQRELEKVIDTEGIYFKDNDKDSKRKQGYSRKQRYSRDFLNRIVNGKLFPKLYRYADDEKQKEFAKWQQKADDYAHMYRAMVEDGRLIGLLKELQDENRNNSFQNEYDSVIEERVNKCMLDIVIDFICKYLIQVDEDTLRDDVTLNVMLDEQDPTADGMLAAKRLQDMGNYYQLRKPLDALLKQVQAHAEKI